MSARRGRPWKISRYTMLYVYVMRSPSGAPGSRGCAIMTYNPSGPPHRDSATYSWPWQKTGLGRKMPTLEKVWPWALLIVMAKAGFEGELLPAEGEGQVVLPGLDRHGEAGSANQTSAVAVRPRDNLGLDDVGGHVTHNEPRAVGQALGEVDVAEEDDGAAHLELELVRREARRVEGVQELCEWVCGECGWVGSVLQRLDSSIPQDLAPDLDYILTI